MRLIFLISPGYNIYDQPPAVFNQSDCNRMWILEEWVINGNSQYDLAVIGLECRVGDDTGSLGFLFY